MNCLRNRFVSTTKFFGFYLKHAGSVGDSISCANKQIRCLSGFSGQLYSLRTTSCKEISNQTRNSVVCIQTRRKSGRKNRNEVTAESDDEVTADIRRVIDYRLEFHIFGSFYRTPMMS